MTVLTDTQIANVALAYGHWTGDDLPISIAVALAESSGHDDAQHRNVDGTIDRGLWQVNSRHLQPGGLLAGTSPESLLTSTGNAIAARTVWNAQGWNGWSTYKSGAYLLYMPRARVAAPTASTTTTGVQSPDLVKQSTLSKIGDAITHTASWVGNPHNWLRVLEVGIGAALVVGGLTVVASQTKAGRTAIKAGSIL